MRPLVVFSGFVYVVFAVLVLGVRQIGANQSPSQSLEALHLGECALPCWIGIMPGLTTMDEAQRRVLSTGATGSFRATGSMSPEGRLIGDYRLILDDQAGIAFISVAFSEGRVNQVGIITDSITLGDLFLAYGIPSCLSSTGDLYYDTPSGRATFVINEAYSQQYWAKSEMILFETQPAPLDRTCGSNSIGLSRWHGIAPVWRYQQLTSSS